MIHIKQLRNVEYLNYFGSIITNDVRCKCEIKSGIAKAKTVFHKKNCLFTSKWDLNLWKKLVKGYFRIMAFYGAETWILGKGDVYALWYVYILST